MNPDTAMNAQSRHTASAYINNLLLSRGLLRNGVPIDFAKPEKAEGGVEATMGSIMNLVHDLILRRDRETDTLSTLSHNIQTLRTSSASQTQTIARLGAHTAELDRQLALNGAQERSLRATLGSAETRNRALREELARLKGTVAQIRTQCATDIRRRDGEIQRLKRHLEGKRGRDGNRGQVGVVVVTPKLNRLHNNSRNRDMEGAMDNWASSLRQETTEFLTQLSQGLSDENDALISLVVGTLSTLRSLQGLPANSSDCPNLNGSTRELFKSKDLMLAPPSYESLATTTDEVLEHLRGLLTNPSFVPLEEVEMREEEIQRLREGWEKMSMRWKEAVALMHGWKNRMVNAGDTINLDDLKIGLQIGEGMPNAPEARHSPPKRTADEEVNDSGDLQDLTGGLDNLVGEDDGEESNIEVVDFDENKVLSSRSANSRAPGARRKTSFYGIPEENTDSLEIENRPSLFDLSARKTSHQTLAKPESCLPIQRSYEELASPPRTVAQKLERAAAEAVETRRREEIKSKRRSVSKTAVTKKLKGSRRRSTLSPYELEQLMGAA